MPKTLFPIPDVQPEVIRPVAKQVITYLIQKLHLPENTQVLLLGDGNDVVNGAFNTKCCSDPIHFSSESRVQFTFKESESNGVPTYSLYSLNNYPIMYYDKQRDIRVHTVRDEIRMECELEITFPSRTDAIRTYDLLKTYAYTLQNEDTMSFDYSYLIPQAVIQLLMETHSKVQSSTQPETDNFREFFEQYYQGTYEIQEKLVGGASRFAITERQHDVLGWFDFTTPPIPQNSGEPNGTWRSTLTYTFVFSKPIQFFATWPLVINNQVIDKKFIPERVTHWKDFSVMKSGVRKSLDRSAQKPYIPPYLILPEVDDWYKEPVTAECLYFLSSVFLLDKDNTATIDLKDLGDWKLSPYMLEYIGHLGDRVFTDDSIVSFQVFENDKEIRPTLSLKNGVIHVETPLDVTKYHHIRIGLKSEWRLVNSDMLEALRRYPNLFLEILIFFDVLDRVLNDYGVTFVSRDHSRPVNPFYPGEGYHTRDKISFDPNDPLSPLNPNSPNWYLNPNSPYYWKNPNSPFHGINPEDPNSPFNPNSPNYYLNPVSPYYYKKDDSPFHNPNPTDPFWIDYGYNWIYNFVDWDDLEGIISKGTLENAKDYLDRLSNDYTKNEIGIMALVLRARIIAHKEFE